VNLFSKIVFDFCHPQRRENTIRNEEARESTPGIHTGKTGFVLQSSSLTYFSQQKKGKPKPSILFWFVIEILVEQRRE